MDKLFKIVCTLYLKIVLSWESKYSDSFFYKRVTWHIFYVFHQKQAKDDLKALIDQSSNSGIKGLADMDARLGNLNKKIIEVEETMDKLNKVWC